MFDCAPQYPVLDNEFDLPVYWTQFKSLFRHSDFHLNIFRNIFERYPLHGIWAISNLSIFEQFIIKGYASSNSFRR